MDRPDLEATRGQAARARRHTTVTTHASCPDCRLRFAPAATAYLPACPVCGAPLQHTRGRVELVGFRLFQPADAPMSMPEAIAAEMPAPDPHTG
jgi:hypothetical protein